MALIQCPECSSQVSDKAESCPHCGYPIQVDSGNRSVSSAPQTPGSAIASESEPPIIDPEVVPFALTMGKILRRQVVLSSEFIAVGKTTLRFADVESLRWGTLVEKMQIGFMNNPIATHRTIWVKTKSHGLRIACSEARVLQPAVYGEQWIDQLSVYRGLKARVWWHCGVDLIRGFIRRIFSGETLSIGGVEVTADGPRLTRRLPRALQQSGPCIPWKDLGAAVWQGELWVHDKSRHSDVKILKVDNAPVLYALVQFMSAHYDMMMELGSGDLARGSLSALSDPLFDRRDWQIALMDFLPDW